MKITEKVQQFLEKASRPGLLGLPGRVLEKRAIKDLRAFFKALGQELLKLKLEELVTQVSPNDDMIRHAVEMRISNVLRRHSPTLKSLLAEHLAAAYELASKMDYVQEAEGKKDDPTAGLDKLGPSGQSAADWAESYSAELVTGLNQTTLDDIASSVAQGIEDQLGVPGTSRLIRQVVDNMSKFRADMIATTEMNRAMSTAALDKMERLGIEYKQIILAEDACPICEGNADVDPIPVDESYPSGDDGPPFHPNCRCAVTGAHAPED